MEKSEDDIYIVGDIRYSSIASILYEDNDKQAKKFLQKLQKVMEEFGVIKLDVCMDALKISYKST